MSKKDLGVVPAVYPMPVLIVAAYDKGGKVNTMNAAWGMICDMDKIALFISEGHKTTKNILETKAFTVAIADKAHMDVADYFGIASGNNTPDKFERTGYTAVKSQHVNAPIIDEFPVTMECELAEIVSTETMYCIVGKIANVVAEEAVLSENGKGDPAKLNARIFDQFQSGYYVRRKGRSGSHSCKRSKPGSEQSAPRAQSIFDPAVDFACKRHSISEHSKVMAIAVTAIMVARP